MVKESKELFSVKISAGKRVYFIDIKQSRDGTKYLVISESKLANEKWEHNRIMIFQEHIPTVIGEINKALKFIGVSIKTKAYSIEEVRRAYPKAYAKWTKEEEDALRDKYLKGMTIEDLAAIFQRRPSAIRSRLRKLGLLNEEQSLRK